MIKQIIIKGESLEKLIFKRCVVIPHFCQINPYQPDCFIHYLNPRHHHSPE